MNELDPSPDLLDLLDRVARPGHAGAAPASAAADLGRARSALRRRRRRALSSGLGALTTLAVLGAGTAVVVTGSDDPGGTTAAPAPGSDGTTPPSTDRATPSPQPQVEQVRLVAQTMEAGPYTFGTTPQGWEVQSNGPFTVTIARVGDPDQEPDSFVGKLVIMLDEFPPGRGERVTVDGREMVFRDNGDGYSTASVVTRPGEPHGTVRIQFPADLGWTRDAALTFLSSVEVGAGAQPGVG